MDINPLAVISFANIFSHSVGCLFILSMVSFAVQKLLSLIRSHLFIFAFISFALGDGSKKFCNDLSQILPFTTTTWTDLEYTMLSKSDKYCMVSLTCEIQKIQQTSDYNKKETNSQIQRTN